MDIDILRDRYMELLNMLDDERLPYETRQAVYEEMVEVHRRIIAETIDATDGYDSNNQ